MTWSSPKMDWTADNVIVQTDMNRIETNINGTRFGQNDLGANLASANNLDISKDYHVVTGNTAIYYMSTTNYQPGARVILVFTGTPILHHYEGTLANYAPLYLTDIAGGHVDLYLSSPNTTLEFIYDGTYWRLIGSIKGV